MRLPYTAANADPATGHVRNAKPTKAWLDKNPVAHMTPEIQASECGMNTRLAYPHVQLFSWFKVNHNEDHYHGCPYGDCWAFTTFPGPDDLEIDFTWSHVFFWHYSGGIPGTGVKLISDPQTGAFGYEQSLSGKFFDGPTPPNTLQPLHDENYPHFDPHSIHGWPKGAADRFVWGKEPPHIKCGLPCGPNKDPGMKAGVYGSKMWAPAPSSAYPFPPNWKPTPRDQCPKDGTIPAEDKCGSFCVCVAQCKDSDCESKCSSKAAKGITCDRTKCPTAPPPSQNQPQPGNDPDKCLNFCGCLSHCNGNKDCAKASCHSIRHGCKKTQCPAIENPGKTDPTKGNSGNTGSKSGAGSNIDQECQDYCKCARPCKNESCKKECPDAQKCLTVSHCQKSKQSSRKRVKACI